MSHSFHPERQELRAALAAAVAAEDKWWRRSRSYQQESQRWQRRLELAERHGEADLATEAARQARHYAALAREAELAYLEQRSHVQRLKAHMRSEPSPRPRPAPAPPPLDVVEARFTQLEREARLDADLAELKSRLGKR